jgi:deazaflavin-dependent oxidoreductase (nitroreductase family)
MRALAPVFSNYAVHFASRLDPPLMRLTRGRIKVMPVRSLVLHTTGARTKQPRDTALAYLHDGDGFIIFATNGARPYLPAWYHNLGLEPNIEVSVRATRIPVRASDVPPEEWDATWAKATARLPGLDTYREKLRGVRPIPLVRLTPR